MKEPETTTKPKPRRRGGETSATRALLIDAAEQLILEEGYAAVTARRLATKAGLKSQLLHYYFETMDDLFIAVIRQRAARNLESLVKMATADRPIEAMWKAGRDSETASFWLELLALANHRKAVRDEVRRYADQMRLVQSAALERTLERGKPAAGGSPVAWTLLISAVSQMLVNEAMLGITRGHDEARALLGDLLKSRGVIDPES